MGREIIAPFFAWTQTFWTFKSVAPRHPPRFRGALRRAPPRRFSARPAACASVALAGLVAGSTFGARSASAALRSDSSGGRYCWGGGARPPRERLSPLRGCQWETKTPPCPPQGGKRGAQALKFFSFALCLAVFAVFLIEDEVEGGREMLFRQICLAGSADYPP